ncbi:hypothetical protein [Mesorhizobium sp. M0118]|uniref:hypothetical protein n=1 Tax=Mesorhizobium sp. M0118 TaxID=2956884 RepID=UPI00333BFEEC
MATGMVGLSGERSTPDHTTGESHPRMAEHHSVWETEDGLLVDVVTPPRQGGNNTLFLRDDRATIANTSGEIFIRTNLANLQKGVLFPDGHPVNHESCALPEADAVRAHQYADAIAFDIQISDRSAIWLSKRNAFRLIDLAEVSNASAYFTERQPAVFNRQTAKLR